MSAPLDQRQLTASLQEFEKHLLRLHIANQAYAGAQAAEPQQALNATDIRELYEACETETPPASFPDERAKSRNLLLSVAALIVTSSLGVACLAFAFWSESSVSADKATLKSEAQAVVAPPPVQSAAVQPVEAASAPAQQAQTAEVAPEPALPEPKKVQTVSILPDGSLAPANAAPPAPAPSTAVKTPPPAQAEPPASAPAKIDGARLDGKAGKKPASAHSAKTPSARARVPASAAAETPAQSYAPPEGEGIFQSAQKAVGSFTGAVKKLVVGN
jgi:hypothetical protein